jgi:hypothetical protein
MTPWVLPFLGNFFPQLFSFAKKKNATVQYFSQHDVATNVCTPLSTIAMQQFTELQDMMRELQLGTGLYDRWLYVWGLVTYAAGRAYRHIKDSDDASPVFAWV